jgi:hypothetical protein
VLVDHRNILGLELRVGVERVHLVKVFRAGTDVVRLSERLKRRQVGLRAVEGDPVVRRAGDTLDRHEMLDGWHAAVLHDNVRHTARDGIDHQLRQDAAVAVRAVDSGSDWDGGCLLHCSRLLAQKHWLIMH